MTMEVVDAHMHLWTPETHKWVAQVKDGGHPAGPFESIQHYMPDSYVADVKEHGITKSIHVEAEWLGDPVEETKWLTNICRTNEQGFPHAIVAHADLASPSVKHTLTRHKEAGHVVGIRQLLQYHPTKKEWQVTADDTLLTKREWLEGVGLSGKHDLSFDFHILPHQMGRASEVARTNPSVNFVVDHCGIPFERDEAKMRQWREGMAQLASCPNVVVKVSGMFAIDRSWTKTTVMNIAREVIQKFGIDR